MNQQLNIFEQIMEQTKIDSSLETPYKCASYRNGLGYLLPWEEPEYLKLIEKRKLEREV